MDVILDRPLAERLVEAVLRRCGPEAPFLATVVMLKGGKTLASAHNGREGQMARTIVVRGLCLTVDGHDVVEIDPDWARRQATPMGVETPRLVGAAVRIFSWPKPDGPPRLIGIIGMLGMEPPDAANILWEVIAGEGLLTSNSAALLLAEAQG